DVAAAVGEIPGEYCAGEYSVHAVLNSGRQIKLAGTAQRVVKGAWLFSTSLVVEDGRAIRDVLTDVYDALDIAFDRKRRARQMKQDQKSPLTTLSMPCLFSINTGLWPVGIVDTILTSWPKLRGLDSSTDRKSVV